MIAIRAFYQNRYWGGVVHIANDYGKPLCLNSDWRQKSSATYSKVFGSPSCKKCLSKYAKIIDKDYSEKTK